jgi:peroxiredoxin
LIFVAGKNTLPDLLGNATINNENPTLTVDEKLLNQKAPEFDLSDNTGNRVRLGDFVNTPVILVFWATWNRESADQIKIFDDYLLSKNIRNSLVKIIAIDSLEESSVVKSFISRGGYNVSVAEDFAGDISNRYNIKSLPTTYFIDKDGIVREIYAGVLSEGMIVDKIENIIK